MTVIHNATHQGRIGVWVSLGVALCALMLAIDSWLHPLPLPTGPHLGWIAAFAYELGGRAGLVAMWGLPGVFALVVARFIWRHTPKLPTDRWWR